MLPGFRFLFAAIVLSMSVLVFGLGAAALLRAAHEEFASNPSWQAPPEKVFAQQSEAARPVLALLRVDAAVVEKAPDDGAAVTPPPPAATTPPEPAAAGPTPSEQTAIAPTPAEPDRIAALQPVDPPAPATAKPDIPVAENPPVAAAPAPDEIAASQAAAPVSAPTPAVDQTKVAATVAATEQAPSPVNVAAPAVEAAPVAETAPAAEAVPAVEAAPAVPEQAAVPGPTVPATFSTKIATLGGPPVTIQPAAKAANAKPDKRATKKHDQAKRVHRRRRIARAQVAEPVDPFAQPAAVVSPRRKPR